MVADPTGPREGAVADSLTRLHECANIPADRRSGMIWVRMLSSVRSNGAVMRSRSHPWRRRVLRLPRNRMGGQGKRVRIRSHPPLRTRTSLGATPSRHRAGAPGPRGVRGMT
jgi:hypothetical protein